VIIGKSLTVTAKIRNTGGTVGNYKANFYIDNKPADSQSVTINPGQTTSITFQAALQVPGQHIVGVGNQTLGVMVTDNRVPITLKIDGGQMDGNNPLAEGVANPVHMTIQMDGAMIKLTAPPSGMTITGVTVFGVIKDSTYDFNRDPVIGGPGAWVYGPDISMSDQVRPDFSVNIYGDHRNKLYSGNYSKDLFTAEPGKVILPVKNVNITGDFYIEVLPYNLPRLSTVGSIESGDFMQRYLVHTWYHQLCIGYSSMTDVQSFISESGSIVPGHYLTYNWMVRAEGYQTTQ
jgi:hypothetical protein